MLGRGRGALGATVTIVSMLGLVAHAAQARARKSPKTERAPRIDAKSVLLVSFDGRKVLYERGAGAERSIASLSKLMATLVVAERKLDLKGVTEITLEDTKVASGGCRTRLLRGMKVRNQDLLHAALLASDNRSIPALGRAVGLSPAQLVEAMNHRAKKMGLRRTQFHDPVGIHHGNVSTAYEMAKILRAAVLNPVLQKVMRTQTYYFHPVWPKGRAINYYNTNALVHRLQYPVYGGKTGFNNKAGYCFASALRLPSVGPVLAVILGSSSKTKRFADFFAMLREVDRKGLLGDPPVVARRSAQAQTARPKTGASRGPRRPASGVAARSAPRGKSSRPAARRRPTGGQGSLHADSSD